MTMTNLDLAPLVRGGIGFDRLTDLMDRTMNHQNAPLGYPPYDIVKTSDDEYRISIAAAGFTPDELNVEVKECQLVVTGSKETEPDDKTEYLHRGIAQRPFERKFQLADHVKVLEAHVNNGMLHIDLKREIPEALKPRTIKIVAKK
jgi:molecular chaperone IbpA